MKKLKGVMSVGKLIGAVIVAIVLGATIGTVTYNTIGLSGVQPNETNITGATYTMVTLVPLFLIIAVVISYVADI